MQLHFARLFPAVAAAVLGLLLPGAAFAIAKEVTPEQDSASTSVSSIQPRNAQQDWRHVEAKEQ